MKNLTVKNPRDARTARNLKLRPTAMALAVAACFSTAVWANPTNPVVVHGTASFQQAGNILNVTNSHNAIINWGSFSIGVNELTRFIQPSALSAVLNRVTGGDPSAILGALQSNGRVFLLNPNGIVFGAGAQIDVAGLVASTLNLSNTDFLAGRMNFTGGAQAGSLVNQGAINATGGAVYLVGSAVTNQGLITNPGGEIVLAAGNSVELVSPGTPNLRVEIQADNHEARNLGSLVAEAGRIGIYAGLIRQGGAINADSAVAEGGRILLRSTRRTDLDVSSVISARGTDGGRIEVLSDLATGQTNTAGILDASASGAAGRGGFVETSAAAINIGDSTRVNTMGSAAPGLWVIDPLNFWIVPGSAALSPSGVGASTLVANLATTPIDIYTAAYGGQEGNILVNAPVSWSSANGLSLYAHNDIQVAQPVANAGTGLVYMMAGWNGSVGGAFPVFGTGNISISAPVSSNGSIFLFAGNTISQTSSGMLTTPALGAETLAGSVQLNAAFNAVGTLAGKARGQFAFKNSSTGNLNVGAVFGRTGILVSDGGIDAPHVNISVSQNGAGALVIKEPVRALSESRSGNATVTLTSLNGIEVNPVGSVNGRVEASAGSGVVDGGIAYPGGNATVTLTNNGVAALWVSGELKATAGNGADSGPGTGGGHGGSATVNITSNDALNIHGPVTALAGRGGDVDMYGGGISGSGGNATLVTSSVGNTVINAGITVTGGRGGSNDNFAAAGHGGSASLLMGSSAGMTVSESTMTVQGGSGGAAGGGFGGNGGGVLVELTDLSGAAQLQFNDAALMVTAGDAGYGGDTGTAQGGAIRLTANGGMSLYNSVVYLDGGETAGVAASETLIRLESSNDLLIRETQITAAGSRYASDNFTAAGGHAKIEVRATNGNITVDGAEGNPGYLYAYGGHAAPSSFAYGGNGRIDIMARASVNLSAFSQVGALAGSGGFSGVGGNAQVTVSSEIGNLNLSGSTIYAAGGTTDSGGYGGAASVVLSAIGPVSMSAFSAISYGGSGGQGTGDARVQVESGTRIEMNDFSTLRAYSDSEAGGVGQVDLIAAGPVSLSNSVLQAPYGGAILISGLGITMNYTEVYAGGTVSLYSDESGITAVNDSTIYSGSSPSSGLAIGTSGDLFLDQSWIYGYPEVNLAIGGNVYLGNGSKIEAGSPDTIFLVFPNGASSNFFVNGAPGVISVGDTGFFVNGAPAQLGINMFVTNGTPPPPVTLDSGVPAPVDSLVVALNQSTRPPAGSQGTGAKNDEDDPKKTGKKDAPVCR
jgi:filamentous hemagglutinin family protein